MSFTTDNFTDSFSESVGTINSLRKYAIAYLFSEPRLKLVELNEQEYMEGQIAYRSHQNEQEMMLEATLKAIEKKISSKESYTILSIGCGSGLFEKPFVEKLLESNKIIHFVGVDPSEVACAKTQEWCQKLSTSQPGKFFFHIDSACWESYDSAQNFDLILLIHSLCHFSEIESSIQKVYELIGEEGMAIIAVGVKTKVFEPFYYVNQRLYQRNGCFSDDLHQVISELNIPFHQEMIEFSVNITECFRKDSKLGKQMLNFLIHANTANFSPLELRLLLEYFGSLSQKLEEGEIMLPHSGTLFYIEK